MEDDTFPMDLDQMPRRKLSFSDSEGFGTLNNAAPERMRAFVRLRPLPGEASKSSISMTDTDCTISISKASAQGVSSIEEHAFTFDGVFGPEATQSTVYEAVMRPQVTALLEGRDTLTFAYGITNAGKTYTVQGKPQPEERGVLPRALACIFEALDVLQEDGATGAAAALDPALTYTVRASFLEVYGSEAHDLLAPADKAGSWGAGSRRPLKIKEANGKVTVEGLKEVELPDLETAQGAVQLGWANRSAASNGLNDLSSRSHAVLCLNLRASAGDSARPRDTRLIVVDLAGAEKQKMTQSTGDRLQEANAINKDLMVLGHCLRDLRWNQQHSKATQRVPPFRNSRITMLFRDFLSGMGQTVVVAALNPRAIDAQSTLETLRFASVAQQIKTRLAPAVPPAAAKQPARKQPRASAGDSSARELSESEPSSEEWAPEYGSNEHALYEQVLALQERLQRVEVERLSDERRIREEVSAEMQKHIEEMEEVTSQKLDEALFSTEEAYHKKLQLVKQSQNNSSAAATAQAHEEMMQMQRLSQRREAETISRINSVNAQLELANAEAATLRKELAAMRAGGPIDEARSHISQLELRLRDAIEARKLAEATRAEAEAAADEARAALAKADKGARAVKAQLEALREELAATVAARDAAEGRRREAETKAAELKARLVAETEQVASLTAKIAVLRSTAPAVAPPPTLALGDSGDVGNILSPKRGLESTINRVVNEEAALGGESPAKKPRADPKAVARGKAVGAGSKAGASENVAPPAPHEVEEEEEAPGSFVGDLRAAVLRQSKIKAIRNHFRKATEPAAQPAAGRSSVRDAVARLSKSASSRSLLSTGEAHNVPPTARSAAGETAARAPNPTPISRRTRSSRRAEAAVL
jgi:hypothetical protein